MPICVDRVNLLAKLTDAQRKVLIPNFCEHRLIHLQNNSLLIAYVDDRVRPQTAEEKELYDLLSTITHRPASSLSSRWREPSLTVHNIEVSGP